MDNKSTTTRKILRRGESDVLCIVTHVIREKVMDMRLSELSPGILRKKIEEEVSVKFIVPREILLEAVKTIVRQTLSEILWELESVELQ